MVESREDLLERCRKLIPDFLSEGDSVAVEKFQAAEAHWQTLCKARSEDQIAPYLEFMEWLCGVERQLVGQSDLPRSLQSIETSYQQPMVVRIEALKQ